MTISQTAPIVISSAALVVSVTTAWLTLLKRGKLLMTQPTLLIFGTDSIAKFPKFALRMLLYSSAKKALIIESMYVKVRRGETTQNLANWYYGDDVNVKRGAGLRVGEEGLTCNHHFYLLNDGSQFEFIPGEYRIDVYANIHGQNNAIYLFETSVILSIEDVGAIKQKNGAVEYEWGADSRKYHRSASLV